jgi:hypothetical protein
MWLPADTENQDSIARLEAMTDADMKRWTDKDMPPGPKCTG